MLGFGFGFTGKGLIAAAVVVVGSWILATGAWDDSAQWDDTAAWKDS